MTNGRRVHPHLATMLGGKEKQGGSLGLKVVATPLKVTLAFDQAVAYVTLDPGSARKLAGVIVAAADLAEKGKESDGSEEAKED